MTGAAIVWVDRGSSLMDAAVLVRIEVFVHEQGVPAEIEVDEYDPIARHAVALTSGGDVVGTMRLLVNGEQARIGRVAVRRAVRVTGIGRQLMLEGMAEARRQGCTTVTVASQVTVVGFYRSLGFQVVSQPFDSAGIAHVDMARAL